MKTGLIVIDIQNAYFPGGSYPLVGSEAAALVGSGVLEAARSAALPVIHFQHIADGEDATFFRPGTLGALIWPCSAPWTCLRKCCSVN